MATVAKSLSILAYQLRASIVVELSGEKKQPNKKFDHVGTQDGIFRLKHDLIGSHRS